MVDKKPRLAELDFYRAVALFLVVFGHLLECFSSPLNPYLYKAIYLFHIPVLVYVSGRVAKFDVKKTAVSLLLPLVVFQALYALFVFALQGKFELSPVQPYWLLWYLLSLALWRFSLPLADKLPMRFRPVAVLAAVLIGLLAGFVPFLDRVLSLSRTVAFYPFFLLGYFHKNARPERSAPFAVKLLLSLSSAVALGVFVLLKDGFTNEALYCATPYGGEGDGFFQRLFLLSAALLIVETLAAFAWKKENRAARFLSEHSIGVYLLHGFLVVAFKTYSVLPNGNGSVLYALLLASAVCFVAAGAHWSYRWFVKKLIDIFS